LRGVLGIGALWGGVGTVVGSAIGVFVAAAGSQPLLSALVEFGLGVGGLGFALGSAFAGALTVLERRRTLDELTPGRAARWGALAGLTVSLGVGLYFVTSLGQAGVDLGLGRVVLAFLSGTAAYTALTAALAAGTVAVARRAPPEIGPGMAGDSSRVLGAASES
jgi:hypothetical protein